MFEENEVRIIGYCAECGHTITDECGEIYTDESGNYFDSIDCQMDFYKITKLEF